jgi:uncharacterized membrane protein
MRSPVYWIVSQRGPMGPHIYEPYYPIGLLLLIVVVSFAAILIFFPSLERVKPDKSLRPEVERRGEGRTPEETQDEGARSRGRVLEVALRLLEPDERRVVEAIVAAGGDMLQKDISYELGFSRVKTHRVVVKLLRRGVVTAEKHYNTNRVELAVWIKEG